MITHYLNDGLYWVAFGCALLFLLRSGASKFERTFFRLYLGLAIVFAVGVVLAYVKGYDNPQGWVQRDLSSSLAFPLSLGVAGFVSGIRRSVILFQNLVLVVVMVMGGAFLSRFAFGGGGLYQTFLRADSTVVLYSLSFFGFLGLYGLAIHRAVIMSHAIVVMAWIMAVVTLNKWNYFIVVCFPVLWVILGVKRYGIRTRVGLALVLGSLTAIALYFLRDTLAMQVGYATFDEYWLSRVAKGDPSGGRFVMWADLLAQWQQQPVLGAGFGVRALGIDVEDHNMFLFFLVRFGLVVTGAIFVLSYVLLRHVVQAPGLDDRSRWVLVGVLTYYVLAAAVGQAFAQISIAVITGLIIGLILQERQEAVVT